MFSDLKLALGRREGGRREGGKREGGREGGKREGGREGGRREGGRKEGAVRLRCGCLPVHRVRRCTRRRSMQLVRVSTFCGLLFTTVHSYSRQEMSIERGGGGGREEEGRRGGEEGRRGRRKGGGGEERGRGGEGEGMRGRRREWRRRGEQEEERVGEGKREEGEGNHLDSSLSKQARRGRQRRNTTSFYSNRCSQPTLRVYGTAWTTGR